MLCLQCPDYYKQILRFIQLLELMIKELWRNSKTFLCISSISYDKRKYNWSKINKISSSNKIILLKNRYMLFKHKDKAIGNIVPVFQITTIFDKQISCNVKKKRHIIVNISKILGAQNLCNIFVCVLDVI